MTRDIVDLDNFIVLIEHSLPGDQVIDLCRFNEDVIGITFYGSGNVQLTASFQDDSEIQTHTKGMSLSFFANGQVGFSHTLLDDKPLQCVVICCSISNISKLPDAERSIFETQLNDLVNTQGDFASGPSFLMNGDMINAVDKIFNTQFTGLNRLLYLRSQVSELLAHYFALLESRDEVKTDLAEAQKLMMAKQILTDSMEAPPSLNELSKMIGLNNYKLKKNFKEMFGVPVFKYLQNERLERAHDLLRTGNVTTQEAAWMVGYESISSFSNAFTKKFGFRPSEVKA